MSFPSTDKIACSLASLFLASAALVAVPQPGFGQAVSSSARQLHLVPKLKERCLEVLRAGLASDEFWPSIHAAEALTLAGHGDEVRQALAPKLPAELDDQQRCGLARELVRAGDIAQAGVMLDILEGRYPYGHIHAAESLYKVGEIGDGNYMRIRAMNSKNPKCQLMAAGALAKAGNQAALELLRDQLSSPDEDVTRICGWLLARIGDASDIPALREAEKRVQDPVIVAYQQHALATLGDAAGMAALKQNLSSSDPALRVYAATFAGDARAVSVAGDLAKLLDDDTLDVRIRAAQSLLVLSRPLQVDPGDNFSSEVYPATKDNPRYSEGSIIRLRDGSLLYAVTEFIGSGSDFAKARIIGRTSTDGGRTWGDTRVLQENIGKKNVMSVSLLRLAAPWKSDTPIGMFYLIKNEFDDLRVMLRISTDEAQTFGDPIRVTTEPGYHVMNNDRVVLLSTGRLLAPVASTVDVKKENHFVSYCYFSDDGGKSWRPSRQKVDLAKRGAMEPEVFEMNDGRVAMIMRTQLGHISVSYSENGGDTWSEPVSWDVPAPEAPSTVRRIPATGDLLLIWNNSVMPGADHGGKRTPLTAAISTDEGRTWKTPRNLETSGTHTFAYTSLIFVKNRAVMSYYVGDDKTGHISSRFRSVPITWFYEDAK